MAAGHVAYGGSITDRRRLPVARAQSSVKLIGGQWTPEVVAQATMTSVYENTPNIIMEMEEYDHSKYVINPLQDKGCYSATSNNTKLVVGTLAVGGLAVTFGTVYQSPYFCIMVRCYAV